MAFRIIISNLAYNEIDEAIAFYESKSAGLGKNF